VGAITLVENAGKTLGVTSAELLRPHHGAVLRVLLELDGSRFIDVANIGMGRYAGLGLLELSKPVPTDVDVKPLSLDHVCATNDTRGAPSGLVTIIPVGSAFERMLIAVYVDNDDGGGMSDTITRVASPVETEHTGLAVEGCPLFSWFPPNPALGRKREVLAVAIAYPYRAHAKPRPLPVIAELVALDDLGRALISTQEHDTRPELKQVAGEIVDKEAVPDPLAGLDE
jgi:hypothetical protein